MPPHPRLSHVKHIRTILRRRASTHSHTPSSTPKTEHFGSGFYLLLAALPTSYIVYSLSRGDKTTSWVGKLTELYNQPYKSLLERNALHTRMVEQAAHDRNLFINSEDKRTWDELRMPELINGGSPYNVPAGHGVDMTNLVAYYRDKHNKEEEEKHALMRDGKLPAQLAEKEARNKKKGAAVLAAAGEIEGKGA